MAKKCTTEECDKDSVAAGKCGNCYNRMWYWKQKTIAEQVDHTKKLRIRSATMEEMNPTVTHIGKSKSKKRKRA